MSAVLGVVDEETMQLVSSELARWSAVVHESEGLLAQCEANDKILELLESRMQDVEDEHTQRSRLVEDSIRMRLAGDDSAEARHGNGKTQDSRAARKMEILQMRYELGESLQPNKKDSETELGGGSSCKINKLCDGIDDVSASIFRKRSMKQDLNEPPPLHDETALVNTRRSFLEFDKPAGAKEDFFEDMEDPIQQHFKMTATEDSV